MGPKVRYIPGVGQARIDETAVRIIFSISGEMGIFDSQTLLVRIVSGLVLLNVAHTAVNYFASHIWAAKDFFKKNTEKTVTRLMISDHLRRLRGSIEVKSFHDQHRYSIEESVIEK